MTSAPVRRREVEADDHVTVAMTGPDAAENQFAEFVRSRTPAVPT